MRIPPDFLKNFIAKCNWFFRKNPISVLALLLPFYFVCLLPDLLILRGFSSAVMPLNSLYIANSLLFPGMLVNSELASTRISPSNASLRLHVDEKKKQ